MDIKKENCLASNCTNVAKQNLETLKIVPFEDVSKELARLFSFFLYCAPDIESAHSKQIDRNRHTAVLELMLKERHFKYQKFCASNAQIEKELKPASLNGDNICLKCKRFVCKRKQAKSKALAETDLDCFLRHIRNSIAHGRVYYLHRGNRIHIVFEDENSPGKLSARIVCIKADLEHWKKVLSNPAYYQ